MDSGRFQRHNGSSLPRNTADREDRFILRSLSQRLIHLINHQTCNPHTSVHMTIYRRLMERNLLSHLPLRPLPLMPVHCRARLQWCLARSACQTLPRPFILSYLSPIEHVWDMLGRRLHLPGNVNDLAQQLEQIWQEIPLGTTAVSLYATSCGNFHLG
ncbi:hypothetical protein TNCV_3776161 [Trichonephila clavipes]|nr:hypothetical protein TNCV_3776161 [Trichonephila clavipes]